MSRYLLHRLLLMIPTLFGISLVTFALVRLAPGDPASARLSDLRGGAPSGDLEAALERFRREHLLDRSLPVQYLHYLGPFDLSARGHPWFGGSGESSWGGLLVGDLGREYQRPSVRVADELGRRLKVTLPLALISVLLSYLIAVPLGVWSAVRRGTALETGASLAVFGLYALPVFWAGLMLQLLFGAAGLDWLPVLGLRDRDAAELGAWARALDLVRHSVLPVVCLSYVGIAYLSRQMRVGVIDAIGADYVRTARAKGLPERTVILKHVLRNSLLPVITLFGQVLPLLVGGSILVETVFDIPGVGRWAYEALLNREYDVIMATTLLSALLTLVGYLLSDVLYALADPRIRYE